MYPAAALRRWGLPSSGYKTKARLPALRALLAQLAEQCGPLTDAVIGELDGYDDDGFDALVCALVARAASLGHTAGPSEEQLEVARREGWIHVPTADLGTVIG